MPKKTIKVKFVGFWPGFKPEKELFFKILNRKYDVQITEEPDYIFCSCFANRFYFDYCNYSQIRIMFSGENYTPDFNLVDYAISRYPIKFFDRNFYLPGCFDHKLDYPIELENKKRDYDKSILEEKIYFANFIASHDSEYNIRGDFCKKLAEYKRVECPGTYLNNMVEKEDISWEDGSKVGFQRKCKFSLCFESTSNLGFTTEKIVDAFYADTIPIYYGNPDIDSIFNPKAFVDISKFSNWDEAIKYIINVDQNDDDFLSMLREPIFVENNCVSKKYAELEAFFDNIFSQPYDEAFRRSRCFHAGSINDYLKECNSIQQKEYQREVKNNQKLVNRIKARINRIKK